MAGLPTGAVSRPAAGPVLAVLAVLGAAVACWGAAADPPGPAARGTVPSAQVPHPAEARAAPTRALRPTRVRVPTLDVDAPVVPVTSAGDELAVPRDVRTVGWWSGGTAPGLGYGTVVLDGHVDDAAQGRGALFDVARAGIGDDVLIATGNGDLRYQVRAVRRYPKRDLPGDVFATSGSPRLVLITCGGPFDPRARRYADNVVVYAVPR